MREIRGVRPAVSRLLTAVFFMTAIAAVLCGDREAEAQLVINPGQTIRAGKNTTVKCRSCIPFQCPECPPASPEQNAPPEPTPVPSQPGSGGDTVSLACSTYSLPNRDSANSSQIDQANKIRGYCTLVLTWWSPLPSQTWCPYIMKNSAVKFCGPYDNYGFMDHRDDPGGWNLGGDLFNKIVLPKLSQCPLRNSSGGIAYNQYNNWEWAALDKGKTECVDFYMDYFTKVPAPLDGKWKGTYQERSWNLRFLDNFYVWGSEWFWVNGPKLTREQQEQAAMTGAQRVRDRADALGTAVFANIFSDVESEYFKRPVYPQLMDIVDYALFEVFTSKYSTGTPETEAVWQRRVKTAQDINKNRKAIAVVGTEYGDYWYNLASGLLACEPGKCMFWQQSLPPDDVLAKVGHLDLGKPGTDFTKAGCYIRPWEKGLVIVNPMDSGSCSVPLRGNYKDLETGSAVSGAVTVKMKDGKVMVKE